MADTTRAHGGQMAADSRGTWRTQGGHMADRGQPFFPKREPHSKLFADFTSIDTKQFFKHRVRWQKPTLGSQNEFQGN